MARVEVVMPQMGESITTGTITKWNKDVGDTIEIDEILLEISTDKVESEIPSPVEGKIAELLFPEGETIDVGVVIAIIEDDMDADISSSSSSDKKETKKEETTDTSATPENKDQSTESSESLEATSGKRRFYTPLVRKMAKDNGVALSELENIKGSGAGGRVNKEDFEKFLEQRGSQGTQNSSAKTPSAPAPSVPAYTSGERVEIIPMDNMRKAIAKNMQASKLTSPHVNSIDTVDMTNLVKFREGHKHDFKKQEGFSLTYTHFILYALVQALKEFPIVNSSIDGDNIVMKKDINLGCAVAVPGNGLVVPVIKGADNLNITGIARQLNSLVEKARNKKLTMDDLSGGTYTFTNNGSFGVLAATPVILQPQVGIFCVGTIKKTPVVTDDLAIAIRDIMYATHTYDHRLIDGEQGSKFLKYVVNTLQDMDPSKLF
ncbi:MAG: dihydrolipoamide acetyltransferase family protein [Bacteriovoracaceae bacterium]|jgi:2-oxoglutarate dehydrogenase E2 component (dihydrolipoamide succinyltransferase)|nr:dihydrolipoamide acetyltransferase family protein [Bacteriovoracaceae bacterium]|tara:strand:+ start:2369 stop:3667 length:1299 start_codon:yes stop_codon:yes gene_type:complete